MNREKVIKGVHDARRYLEDREWVDKSVGVHIDAMNDALALLKEQEARIQKYEYILGFLGIGFRQWATKILDGEAEAICETDEHENKTVLTFKLI